MKSVSKEKFWKGDFVMPSYLPILALSLCFFLFCPDRAEASGQVRGWVDGYVEASGDGVSDARRAGSVARAKLMARRAAITDAQRNLLSTIDGVRVTSGTVVRDMVVESDMIATRVRGLLQGAFVVSEDFIEDGGDVIATVSMAVCLNARDSRCQARPSLAAAVVSELPRPSTEQVYRVPENVQVGTITKVDEGQSFSSLIVDARGFGLVSAMVARILTPDEKEVYGLAAVSEDVVSTNGMVRYANSLENARGLDVVGSNPLVVKAVSSSGESDVVVSPDDAVRIYSANMKADFFSSGRVVIILD